MKRRRKRKQEKVPTSCLISVLTGLMENEKYSDGSWSGTRMKDAINLYHSGRLIFKLLVNDKTITIEDDSGVPKIREKICNLKLLFPDYIWTGDYADYYLRYNDMYDDEYTNHQKKKRVPKINVEKFFLESEEKRCINHYTENGDQTSSAK